MRSSVPVTYIIKPPSHSTRACMVDNRTISFQFSMEVLRYRI